MDLLLLVCEKSDELTFYEIKLPEGTILNQFSVAGNDISKSLKIDYKICVWQYNEVLLYLNYLGYKPANNLELSEFGFEKEYKDDYCQITLNQTDLLSEVVTIKTPSKSVNFPFINTSPAPLINKDQSIFVGIQRGKTIGSERIIVYDLKKEQLKIIGYKPVEQELVKSDKFDRYFSSYADNLGFIIWDLYSASLTKITNDTNEVLKYVNPVEKDKDGSILLTWGPIYSSDNKFRINRDLDGEVIIYSETLFKELARCYIFPDGEWVVITPQGYYNASLNGEKYLNVRIGNNVYSIEKFRSYFFRPDLVKLALKGEPIEEPKMDFSGILFMINLEEGQKYVKTATSREDLKKALAKFKEASSIDPKSPLPYYMMGLTCYQLDWYECAIENLNTYLRLEKNPSDTNEVKQIITEAQQKLEKLNQIKKMMTDKRKWKLVSYAPVTKVNPVNDDVSTVFKIDKNGVMFAEHPFFVNIGGKPFGILQKWSPVEFDGLYFKYEFKDIYKGEDIATGKTFNHYSITMVKGEIILSDPPKIVQRVYLSSFIELIPPIKKGPEARGEVIHEIR